MRIKMKLSFQRAKNSYQLIANQISSPFFSNLFTLLFPKPFTFLACSLLSLGKEYQGILDYYEALNVRERRQRAR